MTAETAHHPSGPLVLALSLAAVAGFVDAHLFLFVSNVFVANMSGNMVRVGISAGEGEWAASIASTVALASFAFGVIAAIVHHDRQLQSKQRVRPDELLVAEAALLLSLPVLIVGFDIEFSAVADPIHVGVMAIGAFAMGMQASSLRRVGDVAVATTYGTGTIVRIGEKVALAGRGADRAEGPSRSTTITVLTAVLVSYILGAAVAAVLGESPWLLLIPPGTLTVFVVYIRRSTSFQQMFTESRRRRRARNF